jgi:hypothetical protein
MRAGWATMWATARSRCTPPTSTTAGWGPNPNGYTTGHQIHWQFEGPFVAANEHESDVRAKMTPPKPSTAICFDAYVAYLRHTATYVEKVYQLEKAGGFVGAGSAESREFTAERLAAGASMLRDMIIRHGWRAPSRCPILTRASRPLSLRLRRPTAGEPPQHKCERPGHEQNGGNGDQQPRQHRMAKEPANCANHLGWRRVQQRGSLRCANGPDAEQPSAQPHKWDDQQKLQRHGCVVCRLNGGKIQPQRKGQRSADQRWNAHHRNAADGESERKGQRQAAGRDALAQPEAMVCFICSSDLVINRFLRYLNRCGKRIIDG